MSHIPYYGEEPDTHTDADTKKIRDKNTDTDKKGTKK
jgi:hypothetical protein